jgi:Uma2 family endonuclease
MAIDLRQPALHISWEEDDFSLNLDTLQGTWTVEQYLKLSEQTNRLIEYSDGFVEVLPMPTDRHQAILTFLFLALRPLIEQLGGTVRFAPLRVQIRTGSFREPDLLLVLDKNDPRRQNSFWYGADLVMEIVSPDNPQRDTIEKRSEYAHAGIPEYWIVDPEQETITVLRLDAELYIEHGIFRRGETAGSALLPDFAVNVDAVLDAE